MTQFVQLTNKCRRVQHKNKLKHTQTNTAPALSRDILRDKKVTVTLNSISFSHRQPLNQLISLSTLKTSPLHVRHPITSPPSFLLCVLWRRPHRHLPLRCRCCQSRAKARLLGFNPVTHTSTQSACCSRCRCKWPLSAFSTVEFFHFQIIQRPHDTLRCHFFTSSSFKTVTSVCSVAQYPSSSPQ